MGIGLPQGYATLFIFANPQLMIITRELVITHKCLNEQNRILSRVEGRDFAA
jgi:hypothetical protein